MCSICCISELRQWPGRRTAASFLLRVSESVVGGSLREYSSPRVPDLGSRDRARAVDLSTVWIFHRQWIRSNVGRQVILRREPGLEYPVYRRSGPDNPA